MLCCTASLLASALCLVGGLKRRKRLWVMAGVVLLVATATLAALLQYDHGDDPIMCRMPDRASSTEH